MKKTIAAVAIMASSTAALAFPGMPNPNQPPPVLKTICLNVYPEQDKSKVASDCDDSDNNATLGKQLKQNGCAGGQIAIQTYDELNIPKCMPAGVVQL
jgi:hypothetical protein